MFWTTPAQMVLFEKIGHPKIQGFMIFFRTTRHILPWIWGINPFWIQIQAEVVPNIISWNALLDSFVKGDGNATRCLNVPWLPGIGTVGCSNACGKSSCLLLKVCVCVAQVPPFISGPTFSVAWFVFFGSTPIFCYSTPIFCGSTAHVCCQTWS